MNTKSPHKYFKWIVYGFPAFLIVTLLSGSDCPAENPDGTNPRFHLKEAISLESIKQTNEVDINLGNDPVPFVRRIVKQLTGRSVTIEWAGKKAELLGTDKAPRRIDMALLLAEESKVKPVWKHSDPWNEQITLPGGPEKQVKRDVGAVFMFFFSSPGRPNGGPGWANNHTPGMLSKTSRLVWDSENSHDGFYHPLNPGFWYRELQDARYAGIDFLLPNVYGPDLDDGSMEALNEALARLREEKREGIVKFGLFDDTWTWGKPYFTPFWEQIPDCRNVEKTAQLLYQAKWKKFYEKLPREHWYLFKGRPFIYFYNSGTLQNRSHFSDVLARMKALFEADFGVVPFVAVDTAFSHSEGIKATADIDFDWFTFDNPHKYAVSRRNDVTLYHCMPRWDSISRSNDFIPRIATGDDLLVKDDRLLKSVLNASRDADLLIFATWNDLGEGTGINRCYDYYWDGEWKQPHHFLNLVRQSQSGEILE